MTMHQTLSGVAVPQSLLANPQRFGGTPRGGLLVGDLVIHDGRAVGLIGSDAQATHLLLPQLAEPHVHLDKCHTIDRIADVGGDLAAAIEAQARDRVHWSTQDLRDRAGRGLAELISAGCGAIRTHIDWMDQPENGAAAPRAWRVLSDLRHDLPTNVTLQCAALTGIDSLADTTWAADCATRIARDGGVLGAFVLGHDHIADGLKHAFAQAERLGLSLDFHVDEDIAMDLHGVEAIADMALATGHEGPILLGHACALINASPERLARVADKLARAGISVTALPSTNLYLQGRSDGTPDRRGLTRIHELRQMGVRVVLGSDNVRDAFCPLGRHDPRASLALGVMAAHLDPPLNRHLPMITTDAHAALGLSPRTVDGAEIGDLILFDAPSVSAWLTGDMPAIALPDALTGDRT